MVRVLLDACVPQWLRNELGEFEIETTRHARLDKIPDSELVEAIEDRFDVLVTLDRNLILQQKITGRQLSVVVMRVASQTPASFRAMIPALKSAIMSCKPGHVRVIGP